MTAAKETIMVELVADTKKLVKGMKVSERATKKLIGGVVKLGAALVATLGARALLRSFKGTILDADQTIKTARGLGIATEAFERLSFVLEKRMGASAGSATLALKELLTRVGKTGAAGKALDKVFRDVGVNRGELAQMSPDQALLTVVGKLALMENAAERVAAGGQLLGEETSIQMLKVAAAGTAGLRDAERDFDRFGSVLADKRVASNIENITDEAANLERQFEVMKQQMVSEFGPQMLSSLQTIIDSGVLRDIAELVTAAVDAMAKFAEFTGKNQAKVDVQEESFQRTRKESGLMTALFTDHSARPDPAKVNQFQRENLPGFAMGQDFIAEMRKFTAIVLGNAEPGSGINHTTNDTVINIEVPSHDMIGKAVRREIEAINRRHVQ